VLAYIKRTNEMAKHVLKLMNHLQNKLVTNRNDPSADCLVQFQLPGTKDYRGSPKRSSL
jgi:hypothetical protein